MSERKQDVKWGRWSQAVNAIYAVPVFTAVALVLAGKLVLVFGMGIVCVGVVIGISADVIRFKHYRCPDCGKLLPPPDRASQSTMKPVGNA